MSKSGLLFYICFSLIAASWAQKPASVKRDIGCGPIDGPSFKCLKFGFKYQIPAGWVDRTANMQAPQDTDSEAGAPDIHQPIATQSQQENALSAPQTLLAIFERPPQAGGETINSAVIIAAENRADYPQVKTAADYLSVIGSVAAAGGLKQATDPYTFTVTGKQLVRADFAGERGKLPIHQSTLVMMAKGEIVSFTFIGQDEDEVEQLIGDLQFGPARLKTQR